ncbi:hypothetical protein [Rhodococcus rhodochrous]|uniref:hypothetical protein n=1 Tax=Rhodococcus rhodochrous TaxID=1829 RepID=UPI00177C0658|nr:hypothetical protein [Rhodococcus rhodochrous]QOH55238.1 hypothetical protein C6Y44_04070 [Rhodococcus rhodochrous]
MNDVPHIASLVHDAIRRNLGRPFFRAADEAAAAITTAGYTRRRLITTIDELLELPVGTVIRTGDMGQIYELGDEKRAKGRDGIAPGHDMSHWVDGFDLPATVLYIPEEES